ncbi:hypothetical protein LOAG_10853 [Loa loa]|uniref:Uncharacterized protein n=1 Tax=Loa loa TaxID=7209 RepID=A0A1S0TP09_LOALO|nr:hypothetical protein LOAG_10853 [Loa loa]EFO17646.1 hypothetical protein LOAG_10853 [Loa loa]
MPTACKTNLIHSRNNQTSNLRNTHTDIPHPQLQDQTENRPSRGQLSAKYRHNREARRWLYVIDGSVSYRYVADLFLHLYYGSRSEVHVQVHVSRAKCNKHDEIFQTGLIYSNKTK